MSLSRYGIVCQRSVLQSRPKQKGEKKNIPHGGDAILGARENWEERVSNAFCG